ncbi:MAG: M20/M25/M40 family metallo-hydrolase [Clostridia bacterium]|nr:M20/M25/M40 family metallo-hydrolase [Clostridia bacterium]
MRDILKKLLAAYGATGREENVAGVIAEMIKPYVDEMRIDALGNLIAVRHGEGKKLMFAAHMDHIGFVVTDIDENGFLRVFNVGGINMFNSMNRHVVFANGVNGVISCESDGVTSRDITKMFIDIGAKNREEAAAKIKLGDVAVYAPDFFDLGEDMIAGPAMDNRVGCAVLVGMLMNVKERKNELVAVFTTQEEVGLRGARAAAYDLDPDYGIALDVTLCGDTPKGPKIAVKAGEGPTVKIMDSSLICSPKMVRIMEDAAARNDIKYQREVLTAGGTDASAIQLTRGGVAAGVVSIACRYVHSACEAISISDVEGGVKLLTAIAESELP